MYLVKVVAWDFEVSDEDPIVVLDLAGYAQVGRGDIERDNGGLLNFGFGLHYCLRVHLAKADSGAMVNALLDVLPSTATIDRDPMKFGPMGMFRRPVTMPIDFGDRLGAPSARRPVVTPET